MLSAFSTSFAPAQTTVATIVEPPITTSERFHWLLSENLSPVSLLENMAIGGEETLTGYSKEYGTHWAGYGKRVGMVTANYGVNTVMEAGLGSIWGEDPRYERMQGESIRKRLGNVVRMTFLARNREGNLKPAYARFIAIPASSFLENTWMPDSEATVGDAGIRAGLGFLSRMGENVWKEFRPRR